LVITLLDLLPGDFDYAVLDLFPFDAACFLVDAVDEEGPYGLKCSVICGRPIGLPEVVNRLHQGQVRLQLYFV